MIYTFQGERLNLLAHEITFQNLYKEVGTRLTIEGLNIIGICYQVTDI